MPRLNSVWETALPDSTEFVHNEEADLVVVRSAALRLKRCQVPFSDITRLNSAYSAHSCTSGLNTEDTNYSSFSKKIIIKTWKSAGKTTPERLHRVCNYVLNVFILYSQQILI